MVEDLHYQSPGAIGPYRLERLIGQGGMAEVFAVTHLGAAGFERPACVKRILPYLSQDAEFRRLFIREARVAGYLSHSNIVQVFDCIEDGSVLAIVMELVDGTDLRGLIQQLRQRHETTPPPIVASIAEQVLLGLHYAHTHQVIHRDISPQNILVSTHGELKIADFGVAKALNSHSTTTGVVRGKLAYMSPEQAMGKAVDARSDLYSAGLVLFELLTGHRFFPQEHQAELIGAVAHAHRPTIGMVEPGLAQVVERLLDPDVDRRYPNASEAIHDLSRWRVFGPHGAIMLGDFVEEYVPREASSARWVAPAGASTTPSPSSPSVFLTSADTSLTLPRSERATSSRSFENADWRGRQGVNVSSLDGALWSIASPRKADPSSKISLGGSYKRALYFVAASFAVFTLFVLVGLGVWLLMLPSRPTDSQTLHPVQSIFPSPLEQPPLPNSSVIAPTIVSPRTNTAAPEPLQPEVDNVESSVGRGASDVLPRSSGTATQNSKARRVSPLVSGARARYSGNDSRASREAQMRDEPRKRATISSNGPLRERSF